jgi:hypothetical protein
MRIEEEEDLKRTKIRKQNILVAQEYMEEQHKLNQTKDTGSWNGKSINKMSSQESLLKRLNTLPF